MHLRTRRILVKVPTLAAALGCATSASPPPRPARPSKGTDAGGAYTEHTQAWSAGQRNFTTSIRVYAAHAVFATFFPEEWPRTSAGDRDKVSQAFPTFRTDSSPNVSQNVGVLSYQGGQGAYTPKYCSWKDISSNVGTGAADSGPIVLFTEDLETSLVVSAYSNFMAHTTEVGGHKELIFGTGGAFESIPAGYTIETVGTRPAGVTRICPLAPARPRRFFFSADCLALVRDQQSHGGLG